ncbi:MAG: hypothetical protein H0U71_06195 [Gammaproteobacteria bacterium]|nr:hypothetical protein [Gammaproteobacteria bacterium]
MAAILNQYKAALGEHLAKGHAKFGKVAPRRAYKDDEDSGEGSAGLTIETHPLFLNVPEGAASDLSFITTDNSNVEDEALDRVEELNPELKYQAELNLNYAKVSTPKPTPF